MVICSSGIRRTSVNLVQGFEFRVQSLRLSVKGELSVLHELSLRVICCHFGTSCRSSRLICKLCYCAHQSGIDFEENMRKIGSANLRIFLLLIAVLLARPGFTTAPGQENIPAIHNPVEPEYTTPTITLTKVWEVGGEDPGFIFNNIHDINVGPAGRIYVLDVLETDVKVFSPDGRYLFKFGRRGQGPGEFQGPYGFSVLPQSNRILIIDQLWMKRFNYFDAQGHFLQSFRDTLREQNLLPHDNSLNSPTSKSIIRYCSLFGANSLILFVIQTEDQKYRVRELWRYDIGSKKKLLLVKIKDPSPIFLNDKQTFERLESEPQYCADDSSDNIYFIKDVYKYDIQVYDSSGQMIRTIGREYTLPEKTAAEYQADRKRHQEDVQQMRNLGRNIQIETLRQKSVVYGPHIITRSLFTDGQHRLWVLTNEPYPPHQSQSLVEQVLGLFRHKANSSKTPHTRYSFDVFSPQGKYLMKIPFDAIQPRCFRYKDGFLYFAALKEDGFPWLFKYRIEG